MSLPAGYDAKAQAAAAVQLERAGVRLGAVLNRALANVSVPAGTGVTSFLPTLSTTAAASSVGRSPASLACSADADANGLHGKDRQRFRRECLRQQSS